MRPVPYFSPFRLISSTTIIPFDNSYDPPVLRVVQLTFALPEDTSLGLDTGAGEYLKLKLGSVLKPRSYSVTSLPSVVGSFDLTVRVYPGGASSEAMGALKVGDSVYCCSVPPRAFRYRRLGGRFVYLLIQGLGITEGIAVVRTELDRAEAEKVTLIHANRYGKDVLFEEEVAGLSEKYGNAFDFVPLFSGEDVQGGEKGRMDGAFLKARLGALGTALQDTRVLVVGSESFKRAVWKELRRLKFGQSKNSLLEKGAWERATK